MSEHDDASRDFEPTPHKLDEARKRGDIVKSAEINTAAAYAGFVVVIVIAGKFSLELFANKSAYLLENLDAMSLKIFASDSSFGFYVALSDIVASIPWFGIPSLFVLSALVAQRAIVFAPEKIVPKISRVSPRETAAQKFGRSGIFEFVKSTAKMFVVSVVLGKFIYDNMNKFLSIQLAEPKIIIAQLFGMIYNFCTIVFLIAVIIGALDYLWQHFEYLSRNKMSRRELMDELKQSDGDPHIKAQRRQKAIEIASQKMILDVPKADVVIVNPTHYAVALQWKKGSKTAPICLAKGVDEVAARIREVAIESGVPLRSDPPTARAIYASVDIGSEIHPEHYRAVATAIRFAQRMKRKVRNKT